MEKCGTIKLIHCANTLWCFKVVWLRVFPVRVCLRLLFAFAFGCLAPLGASLRGLSALITACILIPTSVDRLGWFVLG